MVLEENTNSRDIFESDDRPPFDGNEYSRATAIRTVISDPSRTITDTSVALGTDDFRIAYRLNGGPLRQYQIRFDRMPLQGIRRSAAFGNPSNVSITSARLVDLMTRLEALNGRPLTQTEAESIALRVSEKAFYHLAGMYGAIFSGVSLAIQKRKTFKFPLRKPKPVERYNSFPFQRVSLLTGRYARAAWHTTRGLAYIGVSGVFMVPFLEYLARNMQTMNMIRDERTRALSQESGQALEKRMKTGQRGSGASAHQAGTQVPPASNQTNSESTSYGEYYGGSQGDYMPDDNSPASSQYPYSDKSSNTGVLSDAQIQSRNQFQRSSPSSSDPSTRNTFDLGKADRQPRTFDSEYNPPNDPTPSSSSSPFLDDVSPTGGNDPYSPSTGPSQTRSAWSRIRQSANSKPSSSSQTPTSTPPYVPAEPTNVRGIVRPGMRSQSASARQFQQRSARDEYETSSDSFSFSSEGRDRQLAKEQAQREFDRMVEAERRGEGGSGGGVGTGGGGAGGAWERRRGQ